MPNTITPNMNLIVPTIGQEAAPTWNEDINTSLSLIDAHDHSVGNGVQITPDGLDINADLTFNSNNALALRSSRYTPQGSPLSLPTDLGCVYVSGVDLYFNDVSGNQIRLTQGGNIVGTSGSISGLTSPASASYNAGLSTFVWQSDVNTPAAMDNGPVTIRQLIANGFGVTLTASGSQSANYTLTLPQSLPGVSSFLSVDSSGNLATSTALANGITASNIANGTITTTQISGSAGIVGAQLANATVGPAQLTAANIQNTSVTGTITSGGPTVVSGTITMTNSGLNPIIAWITPDGVSGANLTLSVVNSASSTGIYTLDLLIDGSVASTQQVQANTGQSGEPCKLGPLPFFTSISAGSHTYQLRATAPLGYTISFTHLLLVVYEVR